MAEKGTLALADGTFYHGFSFGATTSASGECVFQTGKFNITPLGMVGYTESLTDPSYKGQILVMTYPLIGNYGVPSRSEMGGAIQKYFESNAIHIAGLVVGQYSADYSHYLGILMFQMF